MRILIIILIIFTSCQNKQETISNKLQNKADINSVENTELNNNEKFLKIPYSLKYNYLDSLGLKINPNKNYEYWQYATYYQGYGDQKIEYNVLNQGGDTSLRKKINEKINPIKVLGIFQGGHPSYRCNYAIYIENEKVNYIKTEEEFRNFLGSIDNLEEAILLARTYGYLVGSEPLVSEYKKTENGFILHLLKYYEYPPSKELIEIKIHKDGFVKTKSLGIFKTGREANE